jgi:hypothetical protein
MMVGLAIVLFIAPEPMTNLFSAVGSMAFALMATMVVLWFNRRATKGQDL